MSAATVSPAPVAHRPTLVPKGRKSLRALVEADMARLNALGGRIPNHPLTKGRRVFVLISSKRALGLRRRVRTSL